MAISLASQFVQLQSEVAALKAAIAAIEAAMLAPVTAPAASRTIVQRAGAPTVVHLTYNGGDEFVTGVGCARVGETVTAAQIVRWRNARDFVVEMAPGVVGIRNSMVFGFNSATGKGYLATAEGKQSLHAVTFIKHGDVIPAAVVAVVPAVAAAVVVAPSLPWEPDVPF